MKLENLRKHRHLFLLIILLLLALFFRFYNFSGRYTLGNETLRDAFVGIEGAKELQLPITGPFSSAGAFTFGAWYWYQLIFSTLILRSPYAPFLSLGIFSVGYVMVMHKIGFLLKGKPFGVLLAFLTAVSPSQILSATHLTNPNALNFFAALTFLLFLKLLEKKRSGLWSLLFGFVLGICINYHFEAIYLLVLPVLLLVFSKEKIVYFFSSILGIFLTFAPLLTFNLLNHWYFVKNMVFYYRFGKNMIYVPNSWSIYLRDFWISYWANTIGVSRSIALLLIVLALTAAIFELRNKKSRKLFLPLILVFLINFIALRYYWGERFYSYFNFLQPLLFLFTGLGLFVFFKVKYGKYLFFIALILLTGLIFQQAKEQLQSRQFNADIFVHVGRVEKAFPKTSLQLYMCKKDKQTDIATLYSLLFVLYDKGEIAEDGKRVGFVSASSSCDFFNRNPKNQAILLDFSKLSDKELTKAGWKTVSSKTIYDDATKWWYHEEL